LKVREFNAKCLEMEFIGYEVVRAGTVVISRKIIEESKRNLMNFH
jgi:hypothetical protein